MIPMVRAVTPVLYVSSLGPSTAFYGALGFEQVAKGDDGKWVWWYGKCHEVGLLIAEDGVVEKQRGPVQLYFQTDDLAAVQKRLTEAGVQVEHLGHPDHAPGGEARVIDPDGRVVMVAQTTGAEPVADRPPNDRSVLRQAAEPLARRGVQPHVCEVADLGGTPCRRPAEVKLADGRGDSAYSCLPHADEVLFTVPGVFLAAEDGEGLGGFLSRRRRSIR